MILIWVTNVIFVSVLVVLDFPLILFWISLLLPDMTFRFQF